MSDQQWQNHIIDHGTKPADQFTANPANPAIHPKTQQRAMKGSLNDVGWIAPVIENRRTGYLIDGHERVWQAFQNNNAPVPYVLVDISPEQEAKAIAIFNQIAAMVEIDKDKLGELFEVINTDDAELGEFLEGLAADNGLVFGEQEELDDPGADISRAEELREKWGVELGQMWQLGEHRLICGDCTDMFLVSKLVSDENVELCLTDPPYNVGFSYVDTDDNMDSAKYKSWCTRWSDAFVELSEKTIITSGECNLSMWEEIAYIVAMGIWIKKNDTGGSHGTISAFRCWEPILFIENVEKHNIRKYRFTEWLNDTGVTAAQIDEETNSFMGGHYLSQGEQPAIPTEKMFDKMRSILPDVPSDIENLISNRLDAGFGRKRHSDVFTYDPAVSTKLHSCPKPLDLWIDLIEHYSEEGRLVIDPFLGSGTTLIACEKLNRKCRAIEISPAYVAVALERWHEMTGLMPELMNT